jgi:hypothetical protein
MDEVKLYWAIFVAVVSAGWVVVAFIRDRTAQSVERSSAIMNRLLEVDELIIAHPDIQKYLSQNAARGEEYFRSQTVLAEDIFYKAKTKVYRQLNSFDELLSISSQTSGRWLFLKPPGVIEISDWEKYIMEKLHHPLYRSILNHEQHIFGAALRNFWNKNKKTIESTPADPFIW